MNALEAIITLGPKTAGRNAEVYSGCLERIPTKTRHEAALDRCKAVWADLQLGKGHEAIARIHRLTIVQVKGIEIIMRADNF